MTEYTFSVQAVYIAAYNSAGSYGTKHLIDSTKVLTATEKKVNDRAQGNSRITALAAQVISYDVGLDTAGFDDDGYEIVDGPQSTTSASGDNVDTGNVLVPYFGLIAQTYPDDGDVLICYPYCKATGDWSFKLEFGKIVVPQFKLEAIEEPTLGYIMRKRTRSAVGSIDFNTIFTPTV
jgi:hypothetical protein